MSQLSNRPQAHLVLSLTLSEVESRFFGKGNNDGMTIELPDGFTVFAKS